LNVKALAYLELAVSDDSKKSLNVCRFINSVCDKLQNVKRENRKYHTVGRVPKSNTTLAERGKIVTPNI
jgi:hypothetical protein